MALNLGKDDPLVQKLSGGKSGKDIVKYIIDNSVFDESDDIIDLAEKGADAIMKSEDPLLVYVREIEKKLSRLQKQAQEINRYRKFV